MIIQQFRPEPVCQTAQYQIPLDSTLYKRNLMPLMDLLSIIDKNIINVIFCYVLLKTVYWLRKAMMCKWNITSENEVREDISVILINPTYLFFIIFVSDCLTYYFYILLLLCFIPLSVRFVFVKYRRHVIFSKEATEQNTWHGGFYLLLLKVM
jgi:hypothetical protein